MSAVFKSAHLEDNVSGQTQIEKERTFYARLDQLATLHALGPSVEQEQWEIKIPKSEHNACGGRIRVRKLTDQQGVTYIQTIKINLSGSVVGHGQVEETEFEVTEDVFEQFKRLASSGMHKRRYQYALPGSTQVLDIDVFRAPGGKTFNWCKIDYEYSEGQPDRPAAFPPGFFDILPGDTKVPDEQAFIQKLYDELFLLKGGVAS